MTRLAIGAALLFLMTPANAGPTRIIEAQQIRNTGLLTLPTSTDTLMGRATTDTLTNKTIDADGTGNSISNIENADIKAAAAIARSKMASGTASHVVINDGTGAFSSEAFLSKARGGTAADMSSVTFPSSGSIVTADGIFTLTNKTIDADGTGNSISNLEDADIKAGAAISRAKLASGTADHVLINNGSGVMSSEAFLSKTRGGAAADMSSVTFPSTGSIVTATGTFALTNKDYDGGTASNSSRMTVPKDSKANLDTLTRKEGTIVYASDENKLYADDGSTLVQIGSGGGPGEHEVWVYSSTGHGSTNNRIITFGTIGKNTGTSITYASSGTSGDSFTINDNGLYAISLVMRYNTGPEIAGVSRNSSQLTTDINNITAADRLQSGIAASDNDTTDVSFTTWLSSGDVIRPHDRGAAISASNQEQYFRIVRIW